MKYHFFLTCFGMLSAAISLAACDLGSAEHVAPDDPNTDALRHSTAGWVMSYFGPNQDLSSDSLHLAYSTDGLHWSPLDSGRAVYQVSGIGTNHIRDPFILRKNDGTFVYLATDWTRDDYSGYWSNPSPYIFVADSTDLITFSNPRRIRVTNLPGSDEKDMHAWAPEAFYDADRGQYAIIWSGNDTSGTNRIYVSYTTDFWTVVDPTPDVYFDPGYSAIDGTVVRGLWRNYYLFYKDETGAGKDIQVVRTSTSSLAAGIFTPWNSAYITRGWSQGTARHTEGPFVIKAPYESRWYLFADFYGDGGRFGCWTTTSLDADPRSWTELGRNDFFFPPGVRHANAVRVTESELDALIEHYGVSRRLRTDYSSNGYHYYMAHSWYHGMITSPLDTSNGQLPGDFWWNPTPGLSNPSDPWLVSFQPMDFPDRYLRVDRSDTGRVPSCSQPSNRIESLCNLPTADRQYLTWVDPEQDTQTFREDATFRIVPALNGDPWMVSYQWVTDPSRYLMYHQYNLFLRVPSWSWRNAQDASFELE